MRFKLTPLRTALYLFIAGMAVCLTSFIMLMADAAPGAYQFVYWVGMAVLVGALVTLTVSVFSRLRAQRRTAQIS